MEEQKKSNKKALIAVVLLIAVITVLFGVYQITKEKTTAGDKNIKVEVVYQDGKSDSFSFHTAREYLGDVLKDEKLVEGEDGQYGLFITSVNGVPADDGNQEWWCLTKGGEQVNTSADKTPVKDGDTYELTLTVGY
ncbi:MAG: DUF4430 domain-containing protein [Eubacteriales bacterium]|nr:DUF4430 domain-containing protein [Eubacteriales bacterium]